MHAFPRRIPLSLAALALACSAHAGDGIPRYTLAKLDGFGGTSSVGFGINNRGWVVGRSRFAGNTVQHAALWRDGRLIDLGTLGSPARNSAVRWPVENLRGIVSGISQTDEPDPNNEPWSCAGFFPAATATGYRCLGFRWRNGVMQRLDTLGGTHGFATGTNNLGITAGWAETAQADPTCDAPQRLGFKPVLWPAGRTTPRALPLPPGASAGAATALNDLGQVVGIAGECDQAVGRDTAKFAVLWDRGGVRTLPTLPGAAWHTPNAISQRGDVVGFGNFDAASGSDYAPHAWLWTRGGGIVDLGTLDGDAISEAWGVNEWRHVVGRSCNAAGACRAVLWRGGTAIDLQTRIDGGDALTLIAAYDIDDIGRITGQAFDAASGTFVAYVAKPVR